MPDPSRKPVPGIPGRLSNPDLSEVFGRGAFHPAAEAPGKPATPVPPPPPEPQIEVERAPDIRASFRANLGSSKWWVAVIGAVSALAGALVEAGVHAARKNEVVDEAQQWKKAMEAEQAERRADIELLRSTLVTRLAGAENRQSDGEDWVAGVIEQACDAQVTREIGARQRPTIQVTRPIARRTLPPIVVLTPQPTKPRTE